ncbi:hypothetical protein ACROYT_G018488 [Oculina patagonica]
MPSEGVEVFSNPLAPPSSSGSFSGHHGHGGGVPALTNEDFRKLLMTPRSGVPSVAPPSAKSSSSHSSKSVPSSIHSHRSSRDDEDDDHEGDDDDPLSRRRKKKKYYAKLKKMEEEREQELASKYRDRARERRDGENPDYQSTDTLSATANYRAVGPTAEATNTAAERRRQAIQESKFLGGDMEHTHLVKGLDFALLQKVRSEIAEENEEDEELNALKKTKHKQKDKEENDNEDEVELTTKLGQKIYKALFRNRPAERNELFQPGRMAYVFDVEDEYAESDIPTTLIRSKADCPGIETQATLTTNDIVINKLTQILLYLRQGTRGGKKVKKKDKVKEKEKNNKQGQKIRHAGADDSIFGDVGEYDPTTSTKEYEKKEKAKERDRKKSRNSSSYFEKSEGREDEAQFSKKDVSAEEFAKSVAQTFGKKQEVEERAAWDSVDPKRRKKDRHSRKVKDVNYVPDSYSECYPGAVDMPYDSDEEADYSKMDLGNKKGPIKRWDFENEEDYHSYMENREALPKAAFQFGIKMSEGRKTRRAGPKDEKAKLDRDWQKISQMLTKRKGDEGKGDSDSKRRKH